MRVNPNTEPARIFSVYLPASLYEKLVNKAGKESLSGFIKKMLEKELMIEEQKREEQLKKRLIAAYQREAKNEEFQKEMSLWGSIAGDGISDE